MSQKAHLNQGKGWGFWDDASHLKIDFNFIFVTKNSHYNYLSVSSWPLVFLHSPFNNRHNSSDSTHSFSIRPLDLPLTANINLGYFHSPNQRFPQSFSIPTISLYNGRRPWSEGFCEWANHFLPCMISWVLYISEYWRLDTSHQTSMGLLQTVTLKCVNMI